MAFPVVLGPADFWWSTLSMYLLWSGSLLIVGFTVSLSLTISREDLFASARLAAGFASLSLAMLGVLAKLDGRDRQLLRLVAFVNLMLVLASISCFLAAITQPTRDTTIPVTCVRVLALTVLGVGTPSSVLPLATLSGPMRARRRPMLVVLLDNLPFIGPVALVVIPLGLYGPAVMSVLVTIGSLLSVLAIASTITWRIVAPPHSEADSIKAEIVDALQHIRERDSRRWQTLQEMPRLLSLDRLVSVVSSRFETLNRETVERAAYELARDEAGVFMSALHRPLFYAQPPREHMVACVQRIRNADLVVLAPWQGDTMKVDRYHWGTLVRDSLDAGLTYPWEVIGLYAIGEIADMLIHEFAGHVEYRDTVLFYRDRLLHNEPLVFWLRPISESVTPSYYDYHSSRAADDLDWPRVAGIITESGVRTVPHDLSELLEQRLDHYREYGTPLWQLQHTLRPLFAKFLGEVVAKQPDVSFGRPTPP